MAEQGTIAGFRMRGPTQSESQFFETRPEISGMASEDNAIVLNPFSQLNPAERRAVAINEATRLFLRSTKEPLDFDITREQQSFFDNFKQRGIPGETSGRDVRATIIGRIISGDPSVGKATPEQIEAAERIKKMMGL